MFCSSCFVSCRYIIIFCRYFVNTFLYLEETFLLIFVSYRDMLEKNKGGETI
ncbi:hypothetical protein 2019_scaffold132_00042 [Bacteriophage sp.]|nr:hypothetical protein 2019_scaffold132_00042 [Bacteriophage sp.]